MNWFSISVRNYKRIRIPGAKKILIFASFISLCHNSYPQPHELSLGIHFDPVISWFASDIDAVSNSGARPGINFGLTANRYFGPNYSFSSGINIINAGGRLVSNEVTQFELDNYENKIVHFFKSGI